MINNPEFIKLLEEKMKTSPEWTGADGVFYNPFSGYTGVKIFAEYANHLWETNGNKIPDALKNKERDYVDYLNGKPEEEKKQYEAYYKYSLPKLYNMIRDGKMTMKTILDFANIFNELGIGYNSATTIADYQTAISEAFKSRITGTQPEKNATYKRLPLSQKEKDAIVEKCHQKGLIVAENSPDGIYVSEDGYIYSDGGEAVTSPILGLAISESLQYQVAIGNAEKLNMTTAEIDSIIAVFARRGIKLDRETLENIYTDKDGKLYLADGAQITDTALNTAVNQTATYSKTYDRLAEKGLKEGKIPENIGEKLPEIPAMPEISAKSATPTDQSSAMDRVRGGSLEKEEWNKRTFASMGGTILPRAMEQNLWQRNRGLKTRKKVKKSRGQRQAQTAAQNPNQNPNQAMQNQQQQASQRVSENDLNVPRTTRKKKSGILGKICGGIGGGLVAYKAAFAGTLMTNAYTVVNHENFLSTILKILFP